MRRDLRSLSRQRFWRHEVGGTDYVLPLSLLDLLGKVGVFPLVINETLPSLIFMDAWNSTIHDSFSWVEQWLPGTSFRLQNSSGMGYTFVS